MLRRTVLAGLTAATVGTVGALAVASPGAAAAGCSVTYSVTSQWASGFTANVVVTNLGDPINGWSLTWAFAAGQEVTQGWNAEFPATGPQVEAHNAGYNPALAAGGTASFGFNGSWSGGNPAPTAFALNGVACTGGTTNPTTPPVTTPPTTSPATPPPTGGSLPSTFRWNSTGILAGPKPDASHPSVAIKDFSVVRHNNRWQVYATTATGSGWGLVHFSFADWAQAASAPYTYLDQSGIGAGYRAAPQVFYFAPRNLWYLVYQTGPPTYSTSTDPGNPRSWSAPRTFIASEPPIVTQNKGPGTWIDFWVICDSANCYLFFSDDNGHQYRAQTTVANFPNGFGNTQIVLSDSRFALFEASNVYKVAGRNQYLLIVEAIGSTGRRYFRS